MADLMKARSLPARRGWHWFFAGWVLLRKSRWILSALVLFCWLLLSMALNVLSAVHVACQILILLALPAVSVSLMNACRLLDTRAPLPFPAVLLSGFRTNTRAIFHLGVVGLLLTLLILLATSWINGGLVLQIPAFAEKPSEAAIREAALAGLPDGMIMQKVTLAFSNLLFTALMALISLLLWFAAALAAWHGFSASKALFFSLTVALRNALPFLFYALTFFLLGLLLPLPLFSVLLALIGANQTTMIMASMFFIIFMTVTLPPLLLAGIYASYRDIFSLSDAHD